MKFKDVEHALKESFEILATPIVKLSSIRPSTGGMGFGDFSPQDRHAQAALIIAMAERVADQHGKVYIAAAFGGGLWGGEKARDIANILTGVAVSVLGTGIYNRRGVEKLVRIYFGQDIGMSAVLRDLGCGRSQYFERKKQVSNAMDSIWGRTRDLIDDELCRQGLIFDGE